MAKIGKYVQNRLSVGGKVIASGKANADKVAEAVAELGEITVEQAKFYIAWLAAQLLAANTRLEAAELALSAEKSDDHPVRKQYEQATQDAVKYATRMRAALAGALGDEALPTYGMAGDTPRTGMALRTHLANVINLLGKHPAVVEDELSKLDTAVVQGAVQAKHDALDAAIKQIDKEERELQTALVDREEALEHWGNIYQGVANMLEGLYRMVGLKELADRVRPTVRRLTGEDDGADIEEPADGPGEG